MVRRSPILTPANKGASCGLHFRVAQHNLVGGLEKQFKPLARTWAGIVWDCFNFIPLDTLITTGVELHRHLPTTKLTTIRTLLFKLAAHLPTIAGANTVGMFFDPEVPHQLCV